jgi:stage II sporulation protein M
MNYKRWVVVAILLFGIGLIFGLAAPTSIASFVSEDISAALKEISDIVVPFSVLTVIFIFVKNASALLLSFAFSPIFCLLPILSLILNGWVIAFVSNVVIQEESLSFLLAGLLPHGIFEIPAFIIGEAAALSFGAMVILTLFKRRDGSLLLLRLKQNLRYLMIALALLLPAAIIETYVTPLFLI